MYRIWEPTKRIVMFGSISIVAVTVGSVIALQSVGSVESIKTIAQDQPVSLPTVATMTVKKQTAYVVAQTYPGRVVARRASALGFQRNGLLVDVRADEGQFVTQGMTLATLDTRSLKAQRYESEAKLNSARTQVKEVVARLKLAQKTTLRQLALHKNGHASNQRLDEAEMQEQSLSAQLQAARARVSEASAAIERIDVELALSELNAPFSGIIAKRYLDEGAALMAGAPVFRLIENQALQVRVNVAPDVAKQYSMGNTFPFYVGESIIMVRLHRLVHEVDAATRTMIAIFDMAPGASDWQNDLIPGQIGNLIVEREIQGEGFWIPITALVEWSRGMWGIYVLRRDDENLLRVEQRPVVVVHAETNRVFVRGAVKDRDQIVPSGLSRLVSGMQVAQTVVAHQ